MDSERQWYSPGENGPISFDITDNLPADSLWGSDLMVGDANSQQYLAALRFPVTRLEPQCATPGSGQVQAGLATPIKRPTTTSDITPLVNQMVLSALETPARPNTQPAQRASSTTSDSVLGPDNKATLVILEFKQERRCRYLRPNNTTILPGQYAIVKRIDGVIDSGLCVDLQTVTVFRPESSVAAPAGPLVDKLNRNENQQSQKKSNVVEDSEGQKKFSSCDGVVIRAADDVDHHTIDEVLPQLEDRAMTLCHQLVHFLHLPFEVRDAEYAFDRSQVNIMYAVISQQPAPRVPTNLSRLQREIAFSLKTKVNLVEVR